MSDAEMADLLTSPNSFSLRFAFDDALWDALAQMWAATQRSHQERPGDQHAAVLILREIGIEFVGQRESPYIECVPRFEQLFLKATSTTDRRLIAEAYRRAEDPVWRVQRTSVFRQTLF
jgi:hypothetical protein